METSGFTLRHITPRVYVSRDGEYRIEQVKNVLPQESIPGRWLVTDRKGLTEYFRTLVAARQFVRDLQTN